jgi:hypothetical protein
MPKQKNIHDLSDLVDKLAKFYRDQGHPQLPKWVSLRLKEIAAIDPGSTAFRYAENFDKSQKRPVPVEGELYISVNHLHMVMDLLFSFFTGAYANISTGPL